MKHHWLKTGIQKLWKKWHYTSILALRKILFSSLECKFLYFCSLAVICRKILLRAELQRHLVKICRGYEISKIIKFSDINYLSELCLSTFFENGALLSRRNKKLSKSSSYGIVGYFSLFQLFFDHTWLKSKFEKQRFLYMVVCRSHVTINWRRQRKREESLGFGLACNSCSAMLE